MTKKRTSRLLVRFGCILLMLSLNACQHIQWVDSPLPVTLNPSPNLNTPKHPYPTKHLHPSHGRPLCNEVLFSKDPTVKNHQPPMLCIPKQAKRYQRPFFLLEDWF